METQAEENYLKAIFALSENSDEAVLTSTVARRVNSKPSSVTDMIKRLSAKNLILYRKYKGVTLTDTGRRKALQVIRKHRLWELFLVSHLNFSWDEVHDVAEQLEHVNSPLLVDRLDAFLNYPARDPHGDIIPDHDGNLRYDQSIPLTDLVPGTGGRVTGVKDSTPAFLKFLDSIGIGIDTVLEMIEKFEYEGSLKIRIANGKEMTVSAKTGKNILVNVNEKS